jgi:hypothetical protein
MPDLNDLATEAATLARDAVYVALGLAVLGLQKAQVQRNELGDKMAGDRSLEELAAEARTALHAGVRQLDEIVETAIACIENTFQPLEEQLPSPAKEVAGRAHEQARELRGQVRELIVSQI